MKLKATNTYHSTPISKKLASNFIELGYGLQVEGMAAEMFFNRSFEPFYPYRLINKLWYDLLEDENDFSSRYETDWSVFDWYHSSYEHNAWFAFPGVGGKQPVEDGSTFIIEKSPLADVCIKNVAGGCHGGYAMEVINNSDMPGGLAQDGKYCFTDTTYIFTGKVKLLSGEKRVKIAVYREGAVKDPVAVCEPAEIEESYTQISAKFVVPEEGRYTFALLIEPRTQVICDDFSLTPEDAIRGFKKNAVEAARYVAPAVVRWPGGCFASFYDWRDGVGEHRPPSYSYFWGGYQYNDIGTDELATFVEAIGAESMICVNMHHPFKRFYDYVPPQHLDCDPDDKTIPGALHGRDLKQFSDLEKGAKEAAAWVEYCNGDENTEGGRARIAGGRKEPYNVKYWEMDNEMHRWFREEEYAKACVLYSRTMKKVDPSIKIGMISYCSNIEGIRKMLNIAGMDIDFLADRGFEEKDLICKLEVIHEFNEKNGTDIKYCNTEWLPLNGADIYNMVPRSEMKYGKCFMFSKWSYALDAASTMMMWQRYGEDIDFINFNNLANTHSQSVIETPKEGAFPTAAGMIMHMFAKTQAHRTLVIEDYHPVRSDPLQVQLSMNETGNALVLNVLNRSEDDLELQIDLSVFPVSDKEITGNCLIADSFLSMNRLCDTQINREKATLRVADKVAKCSARKLSFAEYVIEI